MTEGQGQCALPFFFPAPFDSPKALNSGGLGAGPHLQSSIPRYSWLLGSLPSPQPGTLGEVLSMTTSMAL